VIAPFAVAAGSAQGLITFAVTNSFSQAITLCVVGAAIVALGQILAAIIAARESRRQREAIEEAKQLNRDNKRILRDIQESQGLAKRRTDKIDSAPHRRKTDPPQPSP
jgi:predicted TIM-barrel enzyme